MYSCLCLKFNLVGRHYNHKRTDRSGLRYYFSTLCAFNTTAEVGLLYLSSNMYPPTNVLKRQRCICY